jgi:broad-specificity NMP kinase
MAAYYITGISGVGKTTTIEKLQERGIAAFDLDDVKGLCDWQNKESGEWVDYSPSGGQEFIDANVYLCRIDNLRKIIKDHQDTDIILAGTTANQDDYLNLFKKIFFFYCSDEALTKRLTTRTNNPFGAHPDELAHILKWAQYFKDQMEKQGAVMINTEQPTEKIVDKILQEIRK